MPRPGSSSSKLGKQKSIRFPVALDAQLQELCRRTTRHPPDVIRAAVEMLLADGLEAADARLRRGLLDDQPARRGPEKTVAEHAADVVPLESDRPRARQRGKRGA